MQPIWIAVAILFTVGITVLLCLAIGFAWYLMQQMKKMQTAADAANITLREVLGDGSIQYASKALRLIAAEMPEGVQVIKTFNSSMAAFTKAVFTQEPAAGLAAPMANEESGFYAYDEQKASQAEVSRRHQEEKVELSKEALAAMRSEAKPERVPEEILPPKPPENKTKLTEAAL